LSPPPGGRYPATNKVFLLATVTNRRSVMITLGVILLIVGFLIKIPILWSIGIVVLIIGLVLFALGAMGRAVGGRKHYY